MPCKALCVYLSMHKGFFSPNYLLRDRASCHFPHPPPLDWDSHYTSGLPRTHPEPRLTLNCSSSLSLWSAGDCESVLLQLAMFLFYSFKTGSLTLEPWLPWNLKSLWFPFISLLSVGTKGKCHQVCLAGLLKVDLHQTMVPLQGRPTTSSLPSVLSLNEHSTYNLNYFSHLWLA